MSTPPHSGSSGCFFKDKLHSLERIRIYRRSQLGGRHDAYHASCQKACPWRLSCTQEQALHQSTSVSRRHPLQCGQCLELLHCRPRAVQSTKPPLLFVHGALHGAWCFEENFLGYFASRGYDAYAMSLRGHGQSDYVPGQTGTLMDNVNDIESVITSLSRPPVLIAHSLGGLLAQRILADIAQDKRSPKTLAGLAFTSVPAVSAALGPSVRWFQQLDSLLHGLKLVWWMTTMPKDSARLVWDLFFSKDLPSAKFQAYHERLKRQRGLLPVDGQDLMELEKVLKGILSKQSSWLKVPVLVMAAGNDKMIMPCQVEALAEMIGCKVVTVPNVGHDFMLDTRWRDAAEALEAWIQEEC